MIHWDYTDVFLVKLKERVHIDKIYFIFAISNYVVRLHADERRPFKHTDESIFIHKK